MNEQCSDNYVTNNIRRNMTLDFNQIKKVSLSASNDNSPFLSQDLNMLQVRTPELENMILANGTTNFPMPPGVLFPPSEDPETFANGFTSALNDLHNNVNSYARMDRPSIPYLPPVIEKLPRVVQNFGSIPPMTPVDMEAQERIKLERKRQRNRLAASKCRTRKLERISRLEAKVEDLKRENAELEYLVDQFKEHVGFLKLEVMEHVHAGCCHVALQQVN